MVPHFFERAVSLYGIQELVYAVLQIRNLRYTRNPDGDIDGIAQRLVQEPDARKPAVDGNLQLQAFKRKRIDFPLLQGLVAHNLVGKGFQDRIGVRLQEHRRRGLPFLIANRILRGIQLGDTFNFLCVFTTGKQSSNGKQGNQAFHHFFHVVTLLYVKVNPVYTV